MRYFAYGSNMNLEQMAFRCPGATVVGAAQLPSHRIRFVNDAGGFDGGVATIVADDDAEVWGVVWEISGEHLKALDEWEAYPVAYDRFDTAVFTPEPMTAIVYQATMLREEPPAERYLGGIVRGAVANGLPQEYVERLRRWAQE